MQFDVSFKHMEHSDALRRYVEEKLGKILSHLSEPVKAQTVLEVDKYRHIAKVNVTTNGIVIKGKEETNDMYSSIDLVLDKLSRQVTKFRAKLQRQNDRGSIREYRARIDVIAEESASRPQPEVIRSKEVVLNPMSVDEAVMQMELMGKNFLLFNNALTHQVNVIYMRDDGHYGLIVPKTEEGAGGKS